MEKQAVLQTIENDRKILWDTDWEFLYEYQKAMLLALKECEILDDIQYRQAEQVLKQQLGKSGENKTVCDRNTGGADHV